MPSFIGLIFPLLLLLSILLPIIAVISVVRNKSLESNTMLLWILVIFFLPVIGSVIYFIKAPNRTTL